MASSVEKKYGLITKSKKPAPLVQKAAIFDESSDEEENVTSLDMQKRRQAAMQTKIKKQTQLEIQRALEADPTVYEYDTIYDDMERKKEEQVKAAKKNISGSQPKYIEGLLKAAAQRKKEQERRKERKIHQERDKEGEMYGDKEAFVTSAYKKKMQELAEEEEKERREAEKEAANDVTKQKDLSGFYRHLLAQTTGDIELEEEMDLKRENKWGNIDGRTMKTKDEVAQHHSCFHTRNRQRSDGKQTHRRGNTFQHRGSSGVDRKDDHPSKYEGHGHEGPSDRHGHSSRRGNRHGSRGGNADLDEWLRERDSSLHGKRDGHWYDKYEDRRDRQRGEKSADQKEKSEAERVGNDRKENKVDDMKIKKEFQEEKTESCVADADAVTDEDADSDFEVNSESSDDDRKNQERLDVKEQEQRERTKDKIEAEDKKVAKFMKRAGTDTVMSARERYLARKLARDASKPHLAHEDD